MFANGFTIETTTTCSGGLLNVYTSSETAYTGGKPSVGSSVAVKGTGMCAVSGVTASSITNETPLTTMPHVLTADYLGAPWGSKTVAPSQAAAYLTWAETGPGDANAIHNAGIKTMTYVDPNRTQAGTGDELNTVDQTTYSHDCSGSRVYEIYSKTIVEYAMNPSASSMRALYANYVKSLLTQGHFDAIFEDNAGALSAYVPYEPFNAMPCGYTDSSWIAEEEGLEASPPIPVIFNGLSGLNGHNVSLAVGLLANKNTIGGTYEECYGTTAVPEMTGWVWTAMENSELAVAARSKIFQCMAEDYTAANEAIGARIFEYASFLLTYNPSTSIYRDGFASPSGLHVMPETQLVPLEPVVAAPAEVSGLEQRGGAYARQYKTCYLHGAEIGPCAVVVNPSANASAPFPLSGYHHTLALSGNGVLDGGTVSTAGGAPPTTLAPKTATIVFP
jgi:hypothetical protein